MYYECLRQGAQFLVSGIATMIEIGPSHPGDGLAQCEKQL